jgi:uncharacterized membrane protein (UPF0182 family)
MTRDFTLSVQRFRFGQLPPSSAWTTTPTWWSATGGSSGCKTLTLQASGSPYAEPLPGGGTNYIRNSVKVVIDAYNGSVEFYVADPADPVIATYWRIFPGLFKPFTAMPTDLQKHIRYPEDHFLIQAQLYRAYHMDAPEVFYNRVDLWQFPRQPTGFYGVGDGDSARMAPYYIIMRLPGETRAEFFLINRAKPTSKGGSADAATSWRARCSMRRRIRC